MRKQIILTTCLGIAISLTGCSTKIIQDPQQQEQFDAFLENDFKEYMEASYLNLHTFLEDPSTYGIDPSETVIEISPLLTEDSFKENRKEFIKAQKEFQRFDREALSKSQQESYDKYAFMLEVNQGYTQAKFDDMERLFDSMSGIHVQLPTLLADWSIRNEQDIKDVIQMITTIRPYVQSLLSYVKTQEQEGTLMIDIESVKSYCQGIIDAKDDSGVLKGLFSSIDRLSLDPVLLQSYQNEIKQVFETSFIGAYQDIIDVMNHLDPAKNNEKGLCFLEDGKEYYEIMVQEATGLDTSIKDIQKQLEDCAYTSIYAAQELLSNEEVAKAYMSGTMTTEYTSYEMMLEDLNQQIQKDFPKVQALNYEVQPIAPDLAATGIAAYFNIPPLDASQPKQIRINTLQDTNHLQALETFSTVAHEGLPGHMYQIAYQYENGRTNWDKLCPSFLGYTEGYATYVENYALSYLDTLTPEQAQLMQNLNVYQNCIIALMDIGIHYEGWDVERCASFMEEQGLMLENIDEVYDQIQANPTSFLSYYVGCVQILNLKQEAKRKLKDEFDPKQFHESILKSGPAPFSVVEENVYAYIEK